MEEFTLPDAPECKKCGAKLDGQLTDMEMGRGPEPGDMTICMYCHTVGVFDENMKIEPLTEQELEAAYTVRPELKQYMELAKAMLQAKQNDLN